MKLELWINEWPGSAQGGPTVIEEPIEDGETLGALLNRVAERIPQIKGTIFDPLTESISEEIALVINDHIQTPQALGSKLHNGDRILFLPYLAGG